MGSLDLESGILSASCLCVERDGDWVNFIFSCPSQSKNNILRMLGNFSTSTCFYNWGTWWFEWKRLIELLPLLCLQTGLDPIWWHAWFSHVGWSRARCQSTNSHSPLCFHRFALSFHFSPSLQMGVGQAHWLPWIRKASSEFQCTYFLKHMWVQILDVLV